MRILILGCGPAGLMAAHAARNLFKAEVFVVSVKRKSHLYGCQYLHKPIPDLGIDRMVQEVKYVLRGTAEDYTKKVYGSMRPPSPISPQQYVGDHPAWDLRAAYDRLWSRYESMVVDHRLQSSDIPWLVRVMKPDAVLSSIPAPILCQEPDKHSFLSVTCWAVGDGIDQKVPVNVAPFTVVCDSTDVVSWYRVSNVWGASTVEWPGHGQRPPLEDVVEFQKPLSTDCDCLPQVKRIGRYGQWRKGVLTHHAYAEAATYLENVRDPL